MKNEFLKRAVALLLSSLMLILCTISVFAYSPLTTTSGQGIIEIDENDEIDTQEIVNQSIEVLSDIKWQVYKDMYPDAKFYSGEPIVIKAADFTKIVQKTSDSDLNFEVLRELEGHNNVLQTSDAGSVTWTVNVPETGWYSIDFEYIAIEAQTTSIERTLRINGSVPFNEVRNLIFVRHWISDYKYDEDGKIVFEQDRNGNDKRPSKVEAPIWTTLTVSDPTGYYNGDFYFYLTKGENTITLDSQKEPMAIDTITLKKYESQISYNEYIAKYIAQGAKIITTDVEPIVFEAEHPSSTSDNTLDPKTDRSSSITNPQHATYTRLNTIGSTSWETVGQTIEWTFDVKKAGLYSITTRFLQNEVTGMFVSRRLRLDGEIPFYEANNLEFNYKDSWQSAPFGDGSRMFMFYFSEGTHTLSLEVDLGNFGQIYNDIQDCLSETNKIYLKILQVTGTDPDSYMDYSFYARIPNEIKQMKTISERLYSLADEFEAISGTASSNSSTLRNVARVLENMQSNSEQNIAKNFSALKSYIGNLGTLLNSLKRQALRIDYFSIQSPEAELPEAQGSVFKEIWFEIQKFVSSFFYDGYSFNSKDTTGKKVNLQVWTTVSREYTQIIRDLIDEEFTTAYPNVNVNLKLVTAGTVLPATLAGVGPDVMMNEAQTTVIDYAVRGAIIDVSGYKTDPTLVDGTMRQITFNELTTRFSASAMTPLTVALGSPTGETAAFGIPMTQSFTVMFYRSDILADLGLTVPKTWTEFQGMIPKLQSKNYQVGLSKKESCTSLYCTFIYQNGGSLYSENGTKIGFDTTAAQTAFDKMCSFYTQYRFPISYDESNRFRTGEIPIIIADYITFYNTFTIYATELKGLWSFTSIPGTLNPDGSVNNSTLSSVSAMVIMKDAVARGADQAGFNFMEWWMRKDVQSDYANQLIALLGPAGKYATANIEAFNSMSWSAQEAKQLKVIAGNLVANNEMPGSYIISRYVTFAFLAVYNNNVDPATEIMSYITTINEEMARKRQELSRQFFIPADNGTKDQEA